MALGAFLPALLLTSCGRKPPQEGAFPALSTRQAAEDNQTFVHLEPQLVQKISVDRHGVGRDPQGRLELQVFVRNRTHYPQAVEVQTAFRDENGFDINDETAWYRLNMAANETAVYRAISIDTRAAQYVVRFREGM